MLESRVNLVSPAYFPKLQEKDHPISISSYQQISNRDYRIVATCSIERTLVFNSLFSLTAVTGKSKKIT